MSIWVMALTLLSCSTEYDDEVSVIDKVEQFTVYQAKEIYEVNFPATRCSDINYEYLCTSSTPLWKNAKYTKAGSIESIEYVVAIFRKSLVYCFCKSELYQYGWKIEEPRFITHPFWGFRDGDHLSTQVSIGEDGFVRSAETRAVVRSGASRSYNLYTEYTDHKSQMASTYMNAMLHKEKMHIELWCSYE